MKYEFFSIPALDPGPDQEELNAFISSHRIATVEKQFVTNGEQSFWAICVSYVESNKKSNKPGKSKIDYREILDDHQFALFVKLRTLRKELADQEGIPAFALFTNEQLADMVRDRVTSLSKMSDLPGIGKGRIEKYGEKFLDILRKEFADGDNEDQEIEKDETGEN